MDTEVLRLFIEKRTYFEKYKDIYTPDKLEHKLILDKISLIYNTTTYISITKDILVKIVKELNYDNNILSIIDNLYNISIDSNIINILDYIRNKKISQELYKLLNKRISTGDYSAGLEQEIHEIIGTNETFNGQGNNPDFSSLKFSDDQEGGENGLSWSLDFLNTYLGPLYQDVTGIVFARVEAGKTAFCVDAAVNFLQQGAKVLYLNNEDPVRDLKKRFYVRHFQAPWETLYFDLDSYEAAFLDNYTGQLFLLDTYEISLYTLRQVLEEVKPDVWIVDQADKLAESLDPNSLEILYADLRSLNKRLHSRLLMVTQAKESSSPWLTLDDAYNSRVGKPANCDFMIGLASDPEIENQKRISLPKNKLTGQHNKGIVFLEKELMSFRG